MLVLFVGKSRISCTFLQGLGNCCRLSGFSGFELFRPPRPENPHRPVHEAKPEPCTRRIPADKGHQQRKPPALSAAG
jgi:hypothetical protein